jgi:hypothetical protein
LVTNVPTSIKVPSPSLWDPFSSNQKGHAFRHMPGGVGNLQAAERIDNQLGFLQPDLGARAGDVAKARGGGFDLVQARRQGEHHRIDINMVERQRLP